MKRFTEILVATNLTDRSQRAVERALQLQATTGAALTVLHVIKPGLPTQIASQRHKEAEALLRDQLQDLSPQPSRLFTAVVGETFIAITQEAAKRRADLIVIGEPARYRYEDSFIGTTAERVIRFSDRPVLVVKRASHETYSRVLVPFDMSEGATRALETALKMAPAADFRVVHAWWKPMGSLSAVEEQQTAIRDENDRVKAQIRSLVDQVGRPALDPPQPPKLTIDLIEDNPYLVMRNVIAWPDLLAIGTHAKGRLAVSPIGKLARHLLVEASCDALVAPPEL